jgi:hypothetical protein
MKKVTLLVIALLFVAGAANAQFIGLYTDETHSYWCASGTGFYPVEMWVMCLPGPLGQICAEFMICYPANVIQSTTTWNTDLISVSLGDLASGLSVCYVVCQYDWHWIAHQLIYVTNEDQTMVYVCVHPDVGVYQFSNCEPGYPLEPCSILTNLYLNYGPEEPECQGTGTQDASWGAIKSMIE